MKLKNILLAMVFAVTGLSGVAMADNYAHSLPAVQGYDVVSYHTAKRPIRGNGHFTANHDGALYQFASKANLETFQENPEKYVPAYNGFCAFGVSVGKKFVGDPEVWRIVNGRTYLNLDAGIQDQWLKDVDGRIVSADNQWKTIEDKDPASL